MRTKIVQSVYLLVSLYVLAGCSKDDPSGPVTVGKPFGMEVVTTETHATITGMADPGSKITIRYDHDRGEVLKQVTADASGSFSVTVERLVGYDQSLTAFASAHDTESGSVKLETIPAKAAYAGGWDTARELLMSVRWKSDQTVSRVVIHPTSSTPPYALFATTAQKYFDFQSEGGFRFEVTSPVKFTHTEGSWSMDANGVIEINTVIPVGNLHIRNAVIQHLDATRLTLLSEISDGLFVLSFTN